MHVNQVILHIDIQIQNTFNDVFMHVFGFQTQGGCGRLVFRSLSQMEIQKNSLRNEFKKAKFLFKGWFCWLMKGMMRN